jgi:xylose isomerase
MPERGATTVSFIDLRYQKERKSRQELLAHLERFDLDLRLSVGVWYLSPAPSRFHAAYGPARSIPERLKLFYDWVDIGVRGIEAHYPSEINEDNLHLYQKLEKDTGIHLVNCGPFIFYDREYEFGSLSNPISACRDRAKGILAGALRVVRQIGGDHCGIWPGMDGYTASFGVPFYAMWDAFEDAVAEAMDEVPGVRVVIEPKPYEPVPNNIYRTTMDGLLATRDIEGRLRSPENRRLLAEGHALVGLQPEVGHILMGYEEPACVFMRIGREGRLAHTHWNSQPPGNYDQDQNVGLIGWEQAEAALYALKMVGYSGYFGIDINPERMPADKAVRINALALRVMNERLGHLPHERILGCYFEPERHRGELETILIESRRYGAGSNRR